MPTLTAPPLDATLAPPRPLAPLGGAIVDATTVTFSWNAVPGATAYEVQVSPSRQFAQGMLSFNAGPSTQLAVFHPMPAQDGSLFWRVRAKTPKGLTRWSAYGRFSPGSDDAVDAFRAQEEAKAAAARKAELHAQAKAKAELDLVPLWERDDTNPSDGEAAVLGITLILSFLVTLLAILAVTVMA